MYNSLCYKKIKHVNIDRRSEIRLNKITQKKLNLDLVLSDDELNAFYQNILSRQLRLVSLTTGSLNKEKLDKSLINGYILDNDFCVI